MRDKRQIPLGQTQIDPEIVFAALRGMQSCVCDQPVVVKGPDDATDTLDAAAKEVAVARVQRQWRRERSKHRLLEPPDLVDMLSGKELDGVPKRGSGCTRDPDPEELRMAEAGRGEDGCGRGSTGA